MAIQPEFINIQQGVNVEKQIDLSFICPVNNKAPYLKGFVASVIDQDIWDRCELILVENGSKDDSWKVLNKIYNKLSKKDKERVHLIQLDKGNACIARNKGAKIAQGRYFSFLPADAALFPGMARIWVESLDEFPEYGFAYGGYRFGPPHGGVFTSEKWDLDMLKQYNYVDGSFPLKREVFPWWNNGGWDPDIPALQDWDFWLAIVMGEDHKGSGVKGLYRPEVMFETIPPQPGGLSDYSHSHWKELTTQIKSKWGIPEGDIVVTSPGAPFHAKGVAKILGEEYRAAPQAKDNNFKMVYELGFYPQLGNACLQVLTGFKGGPFPGAKLVHWIGSDIWGLLNLPYLQIKKMREILDSWGIISLVEFEHTQRELAELGITARVVPIPPTKMYGVMPLPKKFTVAVYMPETNQDFYYPELMKEVAHMLPDIDFLFFGNRFDLSKDKNIQNVGYIEDMEKFIAECSAIVRLTIHDGMPISLAEFVMAGRNALFSLQLPHIMYVSSSNKDLIAQRIRDLQKLPLNVEGSKYYRELMDHDKYRKTIRDLVDEIGYKPKEYWETRAGSWEEQAKHGEFPHKKEVEEMLTGIDYKSVIDIGCGNGRWFPYFEGKEYFGIDISERLIDLARQHYPDGNFMPIKLESLEPKGDKYDLAFIYTTLQHVRPEDFAIAADVVKQSSKYSLLIESPTGWDNTYGFNHDYSKYFNIIKTVVAEKNEEDNPNQTLTLMLVKND